MDFKNNTSWWTGLPVKTPNPNRSISRALERFSAFAAGLVFENVSAWTGLPRVSICAIFHLKYSENLIEIPMIGLSYFRVSLLDCFLRFFPRSEQPAATKLNDSGFSRIVNASVFDYVKLARNSCHLTCTYRVSVLYDIRHVAWYECSHYKSHPLWGCVLGIYNPWKFRHSREYRLCRFFMLALYKEEKNRCIQQGVMADDDSFVCAVNIKAVTK